MTPEAKRVAIAEACGWKRDDSWPWDGTVREQVNWRNAAGNPRDLPWFEEDLGAMHEAEKLLTKEQWENYRIELYHLCADKDISATAAQRAEAFLRAIGEWEDDK